MAANQAMLMSKGLVRPDQILGKSDFDFTPPALARIHVQQDRDILASGKGITSRVWFEIDSNGSIDWFESTKLPLKADDGYIYGIVGTRTILTPSQFDVRFGELKPVIRHLEQNFKVGVSQDQMAELIGLSDYDFNIRFLECLDMPLHQFVHCFRMEKARHLVCSTGFSESKISQEVGFLNVEDFLRHFDRWYGINTNEYRTKFCQLDNGSIHY